MKISLILPYLQTVGRACAHALTQQLNQLAFRRDAVKSAAILYLYYQLKYFLVIINVVVQDLYIKSHFVFILIKDPVERSAIRI